MNLEDVILLNLIHNEEYVRRVSPFLKEEYFKEKEYKVVYEKINAHIAKYNTPPTQDELLVEVKNEKGLSQRDFDKTVDLINALKKPTRAQSMDWLIENTEGFCKDQAVHNAIVKAATILGEEKGESMESIPDLLKEALSVSFNESVGHDYSEDMKERYVRLFQTKEYKIPFDIKYLNEITGGGLPRKTLSVIAAGTGAGKSLFMCHCAAANMMAGKNVLYITMELAEERISERIDANILGMKIGDLSMLGQKAYVERLTKKLSSVKPGRMIIKEYPTASAGVAQFRALLNELRLKKDFTPDIIYVDYLNICVSARYKAGSNVGTYVLVKAIAEELRGLATEFNVPIITATQLNRAGMESSNVTLGDVSESVGLSYTADLMLSMTRTEELDKQNIVMFKQLKNRFGDMAERLKFAVGVDRSAMRLFDTDMQIEFTPDGKIKSEGSPTPKKSSKPAEDEVPLNPFGMEGKRRPMNFVVNT